jgi:hypothetical protein
VKHVTTMSKKFTGKNRSAAKFLGVPEETFVDPGFCLGCGENECVCEGGPTYERDIEDRFTEGCCFPGKCLMAGPHFRGECFTVEMAQAFEEEAAEQARVEGGEKKGEVGK